MVYRAWEKRRPQQHNRPDVKHPITELPNELVDKITDELEIHDILKLRLTCRSLGPSTTNAVRRRTRALYIHPSPRSLRAVPEICEHAFSQKVEEVIILGNVPRKEMEDAIRKGAKGKELEKKFATWPVTFPKAKPSRRNNMGFERNTLDVVKEALSKLPKFRYLSYQTHVLYPGLNQTNNALLASTAKKFISGNAEPRLSDVQILHDLLSNSSLPITQCSVRTTLPLVPKSLTVTLPNTNTLQNLTSLSLGLDLHEDNYCHTQLLQWQGTCGDLLSAAPNLINLTLVPLGSARAKKVTTNSSRALDVIKFHEKTWHHLKSFRLSLPEDHWHTRPRRPSCQVFGDVDAVIGWFQRHAPTLETVKLDNVLFGTLPTEDVYFPFGPGPQGPRVTATTKKIMKALHDRAVECEYVVNKFRHHQYCKRGDDEDCDAGCKCDCAIYIPYFVDGQTGFADFEVLARGVVDERWVEVQETETEWTFRCKYG